MLCKALLLPKNFCVSRSVSCDTSHVLTLISSTKDQSSICGIFSVSTIVGNSRLCLVAPLKDLSNAKDVSSRIKTLFMKFHLPNSSLKVFAAKNAPVRLSVRDFQCLSP